MPCSASTSSILPYLNLPYLINCVDWGKVSRGIEGGQKRGATAESCSWRCYIYWNAWRKVGQILELRSKRGTSDRAKPVKGTIKFIGCSLMHGCFYTPPYFSDVVSLQLSLSLRVGCEELWRRSVLKPQQESQHPCKTLFLTYSL